MTSYSDVHVQVNVFLNLPIIVPQFNLILSLGTRTRYADDLECAGNCLFEIDKYCDYLNTWLSFFAHMLERQVVNFVHEGSILKMLAVFNFN